MLDQQPNHMHPGAFKSCLLPFKEQIFDWYYDDHLSIAEICRRLIAQGLKVSETTISRFIKVREHQAQIRKRPEALEKKKRTAKKKSQIPDPEIPKEKKSSSPMPQLLPNSQITELKKEKPSPKEEQEAEALLRHLRETSPQQLWREAQEAKMKK